MELIIKSVLTSLVVYLPLLFDPNFTSIFNPKTAECMQNSKKEENKESDTSIYIANRNAIGDKPYYVAKDEETVSEPGIDYHNEAGLVKLEKRVDYRDVEKPDEILADKYTAIDKGSTMFAGATTLFGSKYLSNAANGIFTMSTSAFQNALWRKHAKQEIDEVKWEAKMRKDAFLASKEKMGEKEYEDKLKQFTKDKDISQKEYIREEKALESRYEFCDYIISDERGQE